MKLNRFGLVLAFLLVAPLVALADGSAPVPAPAPQGSWLVSLLGNDSIWQAIGGMLTLILGWAANTARVKAAKQQVGVEVWNALEAGIIKTYYDTVKSLKAAAVDHKITPEEATALRAEAWENAKTIAAGPAKDALIAMAKPAVDALIERILGSMKRTNSTPPEHDTSTAGDAK